MDKMNHTIAVPETLLSLNFDTNEMTEWLWSVRNINYGLMGTCPT